MGTLDKVPPVITAMPSAVNAFNVKIASPGDAAMELIVAREVVWEWNSLYALERKQVLLPVYRQEAASDSTCDLLIAFFCASTRMVGSPAAKKVSEDIEQYLKSGKPVLIYLSEARDDLEKISPEQEQQLPYLKKAYGSQATIDSYGDEKEFRSRFTRDLEAVIRTHAHFKIDAQMQPAAPATPAPASEKTLSECAVMLLSEACEDFEAYIGRTKVGVTLKIQANGKQLVEQGNPEAAAKWESAFQELLVGSYIHDAGYNGKLFQITAKGFAFLKSIGKTPVGYIAEMGNI
jgi:hypothetical protein